MDEKTEKLKQVCLDISSKALADKNIQENAVEKQRCIAGFLARGRHRALPKAPVA